jgi:hypothetical protein
MNPVTANKNLSLASLQQASPLSIVGVRRQTGPLYSQPWKKISLRFLWALRPGVVNQDVGNSHDEVHPSAVNPQPFQVSISKLIKDRGWEVTKLGGWEA